MKDLKLLVLRSRHTLEVLGTGTLQWDFLLGKPGHILVGGSYGDHIFTAGLVTSRAGRIKFLVFNLQKKVKVFERIGDGVWVG